MRLEVYSLSNFKSPHYEQIEQTVSVLKSLCTEYHSCASDLGHLEIIKRKILGQMEYLMPLHAKIKRYKSGSHVYLEDHRKKIKADCIELMLKAGCKRTYAESDVYANADYISKTEVLGDLKEYFLEVDNYVEYFWKTLDSLIQSISVANKELHATQAIGN